MFYLFVRGVLRIFLAVFGRMEVLGRENIPATGGLVVAANHTSNLDPIVVGCALDRKISYLAKEELFRIPVLAWVCRNLEAFPIKRGAGDRGAIRESLKILESGRLFGIFPEGTRSKTGELQVGKPGAAMIALKANVPILPVALIGTNKFPGKIKVIIGQPIHFERYYGQKVGREELEEVTSEVMGQIGNLLKVNRVEKIS